MHLFCYRQRVIFAIDQQMKQKLIEEENKRKMALIEETLRDRYNDLCNS